MSLQTWGFIVVEKLKTFGVVPVFFNGIVSRDVWSLSLILIERGLLIEKVQVPKKLKNCNILNKKTNFRMTVYKSWILTSYSPKKGNKFKKIENNNAKFKKTVQILEWLYTLLLQLWSSEGGSKSVWSFTSEAGGAPAFTIHLVQV